MKSEDLKASAQLLPVKEPISSNEHHFIMQKILLVKENIHYKALFLFKTSAILQTKHHKQTKQGAGILLYYILFREY